jgi:hypothetical protein
LFPAKLVARFADDTLVCREKWGFDPLAAAVEGKMPRLAEMAAGAAMATKANEVASFQLPVAGDAFGGKDGRQTAAEKAECSSMTDFA